MTSGASRENLRSLYKYYQNKIMNSFGIPSVLPQVAALKIFHLLSQAFIQFFVPGSDNDYGFFKIYYSHFGNTVT